MDVLALVGDAGRGDHGKEAGHVVASGAGGGNGEREVADVALQGSCPAYEIGPTHTGLRITSSKPWVELYSA